MGNTMSGRSRGPASAGGFEGLARRNGHTPRSQSIDVSHQTTTSVTTLLVPNGLFRSEQDSPVAVMQVDETGEKCSEAFCAILERDRITFTKNGQRLCVLRKQTDGFVVFSYERPRPFEGIDGQASIAEQEKARTDAPTPPPKVVAPGRRAAAPEGHDVKDSDLEVRLEQADQRQRSRFAIDGDPSPPPVESRPRTAPGHKAPWSYVSTPTTSMDERGVTLYPYAKITRDYSHSLPQHTYRYRLFDDSLERPYWSGEVIWPGRKTSDKLGVAIGPSAHCFQLSVRSAMEWGGGPVLAAVDAPEVDTRLALPTNLNNTFSLSMAPGMDALGLLCFAVAAEEFHDSHWLLENQGGPESVAELRKF